MGFADHTSAFADDDDELRFEVYLGADTGMFDRLVLANERSDKLAEDNRVFGRLQVLFCSMIAVVEADTDDLLWIENGWQVAGAFYRVRLGSSPLGNLSYLAKQIPRNPILDRVRQ